MDARGADAAVQEQAEVTRRSAQGEKDRIPLRLLHLVDARADEQGAQLCGKRPQRDGIKRHGSDPPWLRRTAR